MPARVEEGRSLAVLVTGLAAIVRLQSSTRECRCTPAVIQRYLAELSGPLLHRIDLHLEVPAVAYKELGPTKMEPARPRCASAWRRHASFNARGASYNALIPGRELRSLSARAHDRILKVARTIADLGGSEGVSAQHLAEAVQYRGPDRSYWT